MESNMASKVEDLLEEVDYILAVMGEMSVTGIGAEFIDEDLMKVESLKDDVRAGLMQFMDMVTEDKYEEEMDAIFSIT